MVQPVNPAPAQAMAQPMMQPIAQAPQEAQAVYGLRIADQRLAGLTRKVLSLAIASIVLSGIYAIIHLCTVKTVCQGDTCVTAETQMIFVGAGFLLSLLVPLCGWNGAKTNNTEYLCCFCGCNFVGTLGNAYQLFCLVTIISVSNSDPVFAGLPADIVILSLALTLPNLCLHFAAFFWGNQLYQELKRGVVLHHAPVAVAYTTQAVQPGVQYAQPTVLS